jgi:hypothetical protein
MDFIILGGGCFGSFYVRQLLRGGRRIGVGTLHVVDHDSNCRVRQEFGVSHPIQYHVQDWKDFLFPYFDRCLERRAAGEDIEDHYVPPTFAPHVLMELFIEKARSEFPKATFEKNPFEDAVGTPVDLQLPAGTRALSFATWTCPASCIEPPICPHTRGPKDWDMKEHLNARGMEGVDSLHVFQCRHYAMGVGTIPVQNIVDEYLKFREVVRLPGTHLSAMASVSSCHGLVGLVEVRDA